MPFLQRKFHFYLTLAVMTTTLLSWFNLNSYCIILLLCCRLFDGRPSDAIRNAFSNKYFLAWLAIFLLDAAGLLYTHHFYTGWKYVESKATLVAIPFILCAGPFSDAPSLIRLLSAYCYVLALICCYCLAAAGLQFFHSGDPFVFFYHNLSGAVSVNAVFFSAYLIAAILYLLATPERAWSRIPLITFFSLLILLLASKLIIIFLLIVLAVSFGPVLSRRMLIPLGLSAILLTVVLACTRNPLEIRYREIMPPYTFYNGVSLRLLIWRSAYEILDGHHAWITGVSAGDSQALLDKKFAEAGCPGFHGYNFHNEYIEIGVRSGLVGLFIFLAACGLLLELAYKAHTKIAWFTVLLILLLYMTESMLEMQHAAFFCCFFPLLHRRLP